ncbi:MAG: hypothetical protein KGN74_05060 [Gemmatimonadota bacterium]|nr:hypothetical protein [Gemmatimonadota bacterium]
MKSPLVRLIALGFGIAVVLSCDSAPLTAPLGSGVGSSNSGSTASGADKVPPTVSIDTPTTGTLVNVGDSILVVMHLHDDRALGALTVAGYKETGNVNLGTFQRTARFTPVTVPVGGLFRPGLRDTVIRRYLQPAQPVDTTLDSLIVVATVVDSAGNPDSTSRRIDIVAGPRLNFTQPVTGDSVPAGVGMTVALHATHAQGVAKLSFHVTGETNWPTLLDTTVSATYPPNSRDVMLSGLVRIPVNAPIRGRITITGAGTDVNGQPGAASPLSVIVRSGSNAEPVITQSVLPRSEIGDSITLNAKGDGIAMLGFVVLDSVGNQLKRDSVSLVAPYSSNVVQNLPLALSPSWQGTKVFVYSFAVDQAGRVGYSVKAGTAVPQSVQAVAYTDSILVAYGETFALPRTGTVGDIAVDPVRGNVFLSNTNYNLLEVWNNQTQKFAANGVAVGALPWGMDISTDPNVLLVANSGGTNISRVDINNSDPNAITEDLSKRILTRNTVVWVLHQTQTANVDSAGDTTFTYHQAVDAPFYYSDRPQYVEQGAGGLIYYSTEPTATATPGTIRVLDPTQAVPDPRHIYQYANLAGDLTQIVLFNLDYVNIIKAPPGASNVSDLIYACDHTPGTANAQQCFTDSTATGIMAKLQAGVGSDINEVTGIDVQSLALRDTTFVARSGDRRWIGFGEADTKGTAGRIIMAQDAATFGGLNVSTTIPIQDIMENASDVVTGLAIDSTGLMVGAHGLDQSYFAAVPDYLHLRLQGIYNSQDQGAGIAFDPGANGFTTDGPDQLAFVASANGTIEIVDVAHYNNRGTLRLKYPLYGPLRATRPLPGDPSDVVLKLYGMTSSGLVVINLRAADIKPPAP